MTTGGWFQRLGLTAVLLICHAFAGCAQLPGADPVVNRYVLASPAALDEEVTAYQQLRVTRGPLEQQLNLAVDSRGDKLQIVVMSTMGQRLATWRYSHHRYHLQVEAGAPRDLPYRRLLVSLQWLFWPPESLAQANDGDWRFSGNQVAYRGQRVATLDRPALPSAPWEGQYRVAFAADSLHFELLSTRLE